MAVADRGGFTGNRGCLHDQDGAIVRHHAGRRWIACLLEFKGCRRVLMQPGRYTELVFLDEATALAAGHRPCAECRRADFLRFKQAWSVAIGTRIDLRVDAIDAVLHGERVAGRDTKVTHSRSWSDLPDGTMVTDPGRGGPVLVERESVRSWTPAGYGPPMMRPAVGDAVVLTPRSIVDALTAGYRPAVHISAITPNSG